MIFHCRCLIILQESLMKPFRVTGARQKRRTSLYRVLFFSPFRGADTVRYSQGMKDHLHLHQMLMTGKNMEKAVGRGQVVLHREDTNLLEGKKGSYSGGEGDDGRGLWKINVR